MLLPNKDTGTLKGIGLAFSALAAFAWLPYIILLVARHLDFNQGSLSISRGILEMLWLAFPAFHLCGLLYYKRRLGIVFLIVSTAIYIPYYGDWSQPVRGFTIPAPWYSTKEYMLADVKD